MSETPYRTSPLEDLEKRLARLEHRVEKLEDWSHHMFEWAKMVGKMLRGKMLRGTPPLSWWRG